MLKAKDNPVELTEHDIYKFAPVFPKGVSSIVYLRYYQHREKVLTGTQMVRWPGSGLESGSWLGLGLLDIFQGVSNSRMRHVTLTTPN